MKPEKRGIKGKKPDDREPDKRTGAAKNARRHPKIEIGHKGAKKK